jgi:hypothetical protein
MKTAGGLSFVHDANERLHQLVVAMIRHRQTRAKSF